MHVLLFLLILLAFPVLEIWILIELADNYGWALLGYLVVMMVLGWRLIQDEKQLVFSRVAQTLAAGGTPAKVVFGSAKNIIAGILLIIPGLVSDAFAVILLLIPSPKPLNFEQAQDAPDFEYETSYEYKREYERKTGQSTSSDVIEGEFKRED
ncbi:MAG: exlusion protein FxsA [Betaproteobacteria bacterium HGW-Betaproteobacteria-1]|jgi:UPF0716 protein FxsA|nr:MAG: exlusion protein FxsA [Betaproteobacteria bacterium HGW-Betaproteobacteria-1]